MFRTLRFLLLASLTLSLAHPADDKKSALDKPTLEAYVRHLFVWGPQIKVEISAPKKTDGWFMHAITGEQWLLKLKSGLTPGRSLTLLM